MAIIRLAGIFASQIEYNQVRCYMVHSHTSAAEFVETLSSLVQRLARRQIVVTALHCNWAFFGSWRVAAQNGPSTDRYHQELLGEFPLSAAGPDVIRCWWDSRDRLLIIEQSPTRPLRAPNQWKHELKSEFVDSESAMRFAEEFLVARLGC